MDELVKRLRELASIPEHCENVADCDQCSKEDICLSFTNKRIIETATKAADAIEFLQTYKVAFENIVSMGGWWLVGQDKNLHRMNVPMNWPPKGTKTVELFPLPEPPEEERAWAISEYATCAESQYVRQAKHTASKSAGIRGTKADGQR